MNQEEMLSYFDRLSSSQQQQAPTFLLPSSLECSPLEEHRQQQQYEGMMQLEALNTNNNPYYYQSYPHQQTTIPSSPALAYYPQDSPGLPSSSMTQTYWNPKEHATLPSSQVHWSVPDTNSNDTNQVTLSYPPPSDMPQGPSPHQLLLNTNPSASPSSLLLHSHMSSNDGQPVAYSPPDLSQICRNGAPAPMFNRQMRFKAIRHRFGKDSVSRVPPTEQQQQSFSKWAAAGSPKGIQQLVAHTRRSYGEEISSSAAIIGVAAADLCTSVFQVIENALKNIMKLFDDLTVMKQDSGSLTERGLWPDPNSCMMHRQPPEGQSRGAQQPTHQRCAENDKAIAEEVRRAIYQWHS